MHDIPLIDYNVKFVNWRKVTAEMVENIKRLSDLLESETKRLQQANNEKDRWIQEAQNREQECTELRKQLDSKPTPTLNGTDSDLKAKVAELLDENAKLAGDLLKMESASGNSALEDELRHAQRRFNEEQNNWRREKLELEAQISELKQKQNQNGQLTNGVNGLNPTPKPRTINGNGLVSPKHLSNLSESSSADEATTNGADPFKSE
ncbi:hypothetical protein M3Y97_00019700 [Aphelenchoides bicaudatus]|nr:hypothetical protein M3Y97_00019700 [Aphelenchoides bicaudatus]